MLCLVVDRGQTVRTLEELKRTRNLRVIATAEDGGAGEVQYGKLTGSVIWSFGGGWEHVSIAPYRKSYTPSWGEMCRLKDMFFYGDEVVVQFHPAKSQYVSNVDNCLHLWRPINEKLPTPPSIMVGVRNGQDVKSVIEEIRGLDA